MSNRGRLVGRVVAAIALVALIAILEHRFGLSRIFAAERIDALLHRTGAAAPLVFIGVMALAVIVSPIPSLPLDILAGRVFGPFVGGLYAALGGLLGAMISFAIARLLGRDLIARFLKGHINFCSRCSDRLLTRVVFLSRLIPFVSFDLVSYGAGLTRMTLPRFAAATFLGMLPLTFAYTTWGSVLFDHAVAGWIGGLFMVALFFLLPRWIERYDPFGMKRHFEHPDE